MKKTQVVSAGIAFVLVITFSLHAQEPAIMVPSAQPDSIVGIVAKAQGLQLVSPDQVPLCGTFWTVLPGLGGGVIPSSPCPPLDPSLPIYQIADGQFLVDETGGQVAVNTRRFGLQAQATSSTAAAVVAAQADAVLNLITQVQTAVANQPVRTMARAMGMDVPSPGDGQQLFAYTFDTNQLWLEITNLANGLANLNLHNATNQVYAIWCTTNLLADWNVATEVWPTNAEVMPCTVPTLERQNLFLRAEDWTGVDANGNGLPDWWEFKYFGYVGVDPDSSPDGNGQSLLYDYQNGFDPTDYYNGNLPILTVLTGNNQIGLPNQFLPVPLTMLVANTNGSLLTNAPVTLTVAQGGGSFASIPNETTSSSIQLRTDTNGQVAVWFESSPVFSSTNYAIVLAQSGTNITQTNFTEIAGAIPMNAVGGERIMALTASGDVVSRGGNLYGELGDYTFLDSSNVVHVVGLTNIVKIASGLNHALAIDSTGALWAWGDNEFGQLGDGGMEGDTNVPVHVLGMTNSVVAVAGGYNHSVVFKADGTVWTWGYNESGQLGVGNTDNTNIPVQVEGLPTNAVAVAAGYNHTLVLLSDGTVWAWGDDFFNQLGDGLGTESDTPVQVPGLTGIAAICAGGNHNLALDTNGNAWAWGSFILFQPVPNIVFGPPGVAGKFAKANAEDNGDWPAMVAGLTNVVGLAAGASHSLLLDNQGRLWAWGSDDYGQLGDGGPDNNGGQYDADLPIQVRTNIISIAAGSDASVVLDGNGNVWQCGNSDGDDPNWQWGDENGFPMMAPQYVDFYSGQLPVLKILNGNNQAAHAGLEFPQLLFFQVTDPNGAALSNVPVSVEVIEGDMALRTVSGGDNYKGLRLTTDANGEVSLTGYANRNFSNPNCFVRVLAASREQIAEADFNETLLPLPTISITSPTTGSSLLIGPNQTLTITVDAGAAPGASIQEVDYYYGTNGTADTLLGVLTQSPYSFIWTNSLWWTNAFVGQYTLSAVAVDNTGGQSDPQSVAFTVALDSDGGGLPDWWQLQYFGQLGMDPNSTTDGSGHSLLYDYQNGIDPNVIAFTLFATNHYVNQTTVPLQINLQGAVPGYIAVLVNDTNLADASWQSYTGSNVLISLGSDDGDYDVWIGLRGWMTNSQPVWQGITFTLDRMPPTLAVTNPAITLVSQPVIQLQGYASEPLASLIYDLTNAAGLITNQTGYITGQYADTNLWNFTTNYFQCYDVPLTNGVNTLTLHATDLAGNTTTTNVSFTLDYSGDTTPPVLTLVWPQDGTVVGRSSFTLQAQVDDATAQVVAFIVDANGDTNTVQGLVERNGLVWAYNLPLAAGMNTLTITATDAAGNSSVTNISLFQSSVTVTMNPLTSDQLNQSFVSVSGTVSDATAQVFVNGVQATVNSDGTWSADHVPVNPGGTAVFDVEVYSGSSSLAVSNLKPGRSVQANDTGGNTSDEFPQIKPPVVQAISYECKMTFRENITLCGEARSGDYSGEVVVIENVQWNNGGSSSGFVSAWDTDGEVWNFLDYYLPGEQPWVNFSSEISGPSTVDLGPDCGTAQRTITRQIGTAIQVVAGGPAQVGAGNQLIHLLVSAAGYSDLGMEWPNGDFMFGYCMPAGDIPVPATAIQMLGQPVTPTATNDYVGEMFVVIPAGGKQNLPVMVTDTNSSAFSFNVQAFAVNSQIFANGIDLSTNTPKFCVGQQVTFSNYFDPPITNFVASKTPKWVFTGNYVNNYTGGSSSSSTNYFTDSDKLTNDTTSAWWVSGGANPPATNTVMLGENLTLNNGQQVVVTAKGQFSMFKPSVAMVDPHQHGPPTVIWERPWSLIPPGGAIQLGVQGGTNNMSYLCRVISSDFGGEAKITQICNIDATGLSGSCSGCLDGSDPYNGLGIDGQECSVKVFKKPNPTGNDNEMNLDDAPDANDLYVLRTISINDNFIDYVRFNPDPSGDGIYVTLAKITWDVSASVTYANTNITQNSDKGPHGPTDSDEFPIWTTTR